MSAYKLIYFNVKGRAETSRLVFAHAGVEYEDFRVEYKSEDWPKLKSTTPTGQLPVLEVDGTPLPGSGPIVRFLAKKFDLAGSSDIETAEIDGIHDVLMDFMMFFVRILESNDESKKAELVKEVEEKAIPRYWGVIEKRLENNESGWAYGSKPTYVDFAIYTAIDFIIKPFPDFLEKHPATAKLRAAVEALPRIAEWLEKRPKTDV